MLERVKAQAQKEFLPVVVDIEKAFIARLIEEGFEIGTQKESTRLRVDVSAIVTSKIGAYLDKSVALALGELAMDQSSFEKESLNAVLLEPTQKEDSLTTEALIAAYLLWPMAVDGLKNPLLNPFLNNFKTLSADLVSTAIRQSYAQGESVQDLILRIKGTKALKFRDGVSEKIRRNHKAVISTAIQHVATVARVEAMKKKAIKQYRWVSVLDGKTSQICRGLSGQIFFFGKGPLPPAHWACRSTIAPVIDGRLLKDGLSSAGATSDLSYYDWLKTQPLKFQDLAIGPNRGKLLRNGGLTSKEFSRLSLDRNFQPLTLAEMRAERPAVFEEAGI